MLIDETELLRRVRALDELALAAVFDIYYEPLYRYIYHHVGHATTAEDLAAEVFNRLLGKLEEGSGPRHYLKAWLYRVAHNLVVDDARRRKHRDHDPLDPDMADDSAGTAARAHHVIRAGHVQRALSALTDKQRTVVVMKYLEGWENEEIAFTLGLSVGAVKSLRVRGVDALRRELTRMGIITGEEE
jgi:RNA polymerase sigma-70 factor (ECF subfamily)